MPEANRISRLLDATFRGPAWHGPSVMENLSGVTAAQAASRPAASAHTIWELVQHMENWMRIVWRSLEGDPYPDFKNMKPEEDWPPVGDVSDAEWQKTIAGLESRQAQLAESARKFPDERLRDTVPDMPFSYYAMLHGAIHHNVYHAGQIALLKKLG